MLIVRRPAFVWFLIALAAASLLHAGVWYLSRLLIAGGSAAAYEASRQVLLALFWMVGVAALWMIQPPSSRFKAFAHIVICAFFICLLGSFLAFSNLTLTQRFEFSFHNLMIFGLIALPLIAGQLVLALPSAALFQHIFLDRRRDTAVPVSQNPL